METPRLLLRLRTPELMEQVKRMAHDEQVTFYGTDNEDVLAKERALLEKSPEGGSIKFRWWDIILKAENRVIGAGGYHEWHFKHDRAEIGYSLHLDSDKRKGYMTEAVEAILKYGFDTMELNRVIACIGPDNVASLKLIQKWNFTKEGLLRQDYKIDDTYLDSEIFGLLKSEYRPLSEL